MNGNKYTFQDNSFDYIRITAAVFVMYGHIISHLRLQMPSMCSFIHSSFPGVIVLFFLSGFLISASVEREKESTHRYKAINYFISRFFRIYPAIIAAFIISVMTIIIWGNAKAPALEWGKWAISQLSFAQFYSPPFLKNFGVGAPNGSLWTIPIELQWYFLAWIIYPKLKKLSVVKQIITLVCSILISCIYPFTESILPRKLFLLIDLTVIPYLYIFLIGAIMCAHKEKIIPILKKFWVLLSAGYCLWRIVNNKLLHFTYGTYVDVISGILLSLAVASIGYATGKKRVKVDLTYGIYLYHMVVVNVVVELFGRGSYCYGIVAAVITILLSMLSWYLIEKPVGRFKTNLLNKINKY